MPKLSHVITLLILWLWCKDIAKDYERYTDMQYLTQLDQTLLNIGCCFVYLWCFCSMATLPSNPSSFWSGHTQAWTEASSSIWVQMSKIKCNTRLTVRQDSLVKSQESSPLELLEANPEGSLRHVGPVDLPLQSCSVISIVIFILLIQIELSSREHSAFTHRQHLNRWDTKGSLRSYKHRRFKNTKGRSTNACYPLLVVGIHFPGFLQQF